MGAQESGALLRPMPPDALTASPRKSKQPTPSANLQAGRAQAVPSLRGGAGAALLRPAQAAFRPEAGKAPPRETPVGKRSPAGGTAASPYAMEAGLQPPATAGGPPSAPSAIEAAGWERISDAPNQTTPDPLAGLEALVPELLSEPDDDWPDESEADAVPTSSMPVPVSVPLYDFSAQGGARHTGRWIALGIVAALGAACAVCWKLGLLPLP